MAGRLLECRFPVADLQKRNAKSMKKAYYGLLTALILYSGLAAATDDWALKSPSPHPTIRRYHRMAYGGDDRVIIFGGGVGG